MDDHVDLQSFAEFRDILQFSFIKDYPVSTYIKYSPVVSFHGLFVVKDI